MTENRPHRVVVVGAGLAGLSAALELSDGGAAVTLLEGRPRLGGATWSFERNGLSFDNGQHVFLRCCTAYRTFLERIGTAQHAPLRRLSIPVLSPSPTGGPPRVSFIKRSGLPAPLHLANSLLTYRHLSFLDRLKIGRAAFALRRLDLDDPALDNETFASFLSRHGQSAAAISALWDLIVLPTTNVRAEEVSLTLAAKVFRTGLLSDADAGDIGWSDVPLGELHVEPAVAILERAGAAVHRRSRVTAVTLADGTTGPSVSGVMADGEWVEADAVVLAVGHDAAADLAPDGSGVDRVGLRRLGQSPIVDVHVIYDRTVCDYEVAAGVGTPIQFVFDKSAAAGLEPGGRQCLAVSISGADAEHGERPEVLIDRYTRALAQLFPRARDASVVDAVVSREHTATFRGIPGTARLRPGSRTSIPNLFLAGAFTDTGWPATMEGAVRSGVRAADLALAGLASPGVGGRERRGNVSTEVVS